MVRFVPWAFKPRSPGPYSDTVLAAPDRFQLCLSSASIPAFGDAMESPVWYRSPDSSGVPRDARACLLNLPAVVFAAAVSLWL